MKTQRISRRHADVTAYDLSEKWCTSLAQCTRTLKNNMHEFLSSAILKLDRIYHTDILFTRKIPKIQWSFDMMNRIQINGWKSVLTLF